MSKQYATALAVTLLLLVAAASVLFWKNTAKPAEASGIAVDSPALVVPEDTVPPPEPPLARIPVAQTVTIAAYFKYLDSLIRQYDTLVPYDLSEHLIVRANPWLIDTLENTDYYRQMAQGIFIYDQRKMIVLNPGDTLCLPGPQTAAALLDKMKHTRLDINIPAFQLRIIEYDSMVYQFPVRVGKNEKKYLEMAHGKVDLRTRTGTGEIIRLNRNPAFYKPATGERYFYTIRDDGRTTWMPTIPWIEPMINGQRFGQMIHPTTNPETLGKPASHGCIGLKEADAWRVYYYAPLGTKVVVRYDLTEVTAEGDTLRFDNIYHYKSGKIAVQASLSVPWKVPGRCACEP